MSEISPAPNVFAPLSRTPPHHLPVEGTFSPTSAPESTGNPQVSGTGVAGMSSSMEGSNEDMEKGDITNADTVSVLSQDMKHRQEFKGLTLLWLAFQSVG
jgi:hypothetical protein